MRRGCRFDHNADQGSRHAVIRQSDYPLIFSLCQCAGYHLYMYISCTSTSSSNCEAQLPQRHPSVKKFKSLDSHWPEAFPLASRDIHTMVMICVPSRPLLARLGAKQEPWWVAHSFPVPCIDPLSAKTHRCLNHGPESTVLPSSETS